MLLLTNLSSTTHSNACLWLSPKKQNKTKHFCAQLEASIYLAAFVIFFYQGVYLQTRLFTYLSGSPSAGELSSISVKSWAQKTKKITSILAKQNTTKNAPSKEIRLWTDRSQIRKHQSTSRLVHVTLKVYYQFPVILFSIVPVTEEKYYKRKTKTYKM